MPNIIETVSSVLREEPDVLSLFLFGSQVKGNIKKESDYDFYVILDKNTKDSLREDQLTRKILDATDGAAIHLTFQYLIVIDEDRSLLLKINDEGKMLFSKALLLGSHDQFGLQKYYLCSWRVDAERFPKKKDREKGVSSSRQQILRLLRGYKQKYLYKGEEKVSERKGMIDGIGLIGTTSGTPDILLVLDSMLHHFSHEIEGHFGKIKVLNEVYIPREKIRGLSRYQVKQWLEFHLQKGEEEVFVQSFKYFDGKLFVRYISDNQKRNTTIKVNTLPEDTRRKLKSETTEEFS